MNEINEPQDVSSFVSKENFPKLSDRTRIRIKMAKFALGDALSMQQDLLRSLREGQGEAAFEIVDDLQDMRQGLNEMKLYRYILDERLGTLQLQNDVLARQDSFIEEIAA